MKPKYKADSHTVTKDGHSMFTEDIVKDIQALQRKVEELEGAEQTVPSESSGSVPWVGKLHHARQLCDDWGCIRDEAGNRIMTIQIQNCDEGFLAKHRRENTDPTQEIVDTVLSKLNEPNSLLYGIIPPN